MPDASKRRAKTAPAASTPSVLSLLEAYLDGKVNRKKATRALLGCSERTAGRITSKVNPYRAPMKMQWVTRICDAVGKPVGDVLGYRKARTWQQCLLGWNHARNTTEALQLAADCALSIVYRALEGYQLSGNFVLNYAGGYPQEVVIYLSTAPQLHVLQGRYAMHRLVISLERAYNGGQDRMMLRHIKPQSESPSDKSFLTNQLLENTLSNIHALTKNFSAKLQRETARSTA
jgi:hypothetical protein